MNPPPLISYRQCLTNRACRLGRAMRRRMFIVCLFPLASAQAQLIDYVMQPGDNPWQVAQQHLKPGLVDALLELNHITDPLRIPPGTRLQIRNEWLFRGSRPVTVLDVVGDAVLVSVRGATRALTPGERIPAQSRIRTATQASVTLQFADGSRLLVREHSDVRLRKNSFVPLAEGRDIRLNVPLGKVENDVSKQHGSPGRFEIDTPSGVAAVRGTRFRVASLDREMRTEVTEGRVAMGAKRGSQTALPAGYGMAVRPGLTAESKRLLAAPVVDSAQLLVEYLPADLPLTAVSGAVAYRTQVSLDGPLAPSLSDQKITTATMRIRDIPDGVYRLRVRAIDVDGLEGLETERPLTVNARPSAPFLISPNADAGLTSKRPTFSWAKHPEAARYHFQLADNARFDPVQTDVADLSNPAYQLPQDLPEGDYHWRVATVSAKEGQGPFGAAGHFQRLPAAPGLIAPQGDSRLLRWQKQDGARYHLQIGTTPDLDKPLIDRKTDEPAFSLDDLDGGTYYVRVRTLGASGLNSPWTDTQAFVVESRNSPWLWLLPLPLLLLL